MSQVNASAQDGGQANQGIDNASTTASTIPRRASTASTVSSSQGTSTRSVRMVRMYHVATPPPVPEHYDLGSDLEDEDEWYGVRMVCEKCFDMAAGDDDVDHGSMGEERDALMDWHHDLSSPMALWIRFGGSPWNMNLRQLHQPLPLYHQWSSHS